ncbi:MAG: hypothetical protein ACK559_04945, partial [bacterium]
VLGRLATVHGDDVADRGQPRRVRREVRAQPIGQRRIGAGEPIIDHHPRAARRDVGIASERVHERGIAGIEQPAGETHAVREARRHGTVEDERGGIGRGVGAGRSHGTARVVASGPPP